MAWLTLVVAGVFEVVWASLLPLTKGFTRPMPTAGFVVALGASMYLLGMAARTIPIGTAYAVWVGIGAVGAYLVGVLALGESTSPAQATAMAFLVASLVAVKVTAT